MKKEVKIGEVIKFNKTETIIDIIHGREFIILEGSIAIVCSNGFLKMILGNYKGEKIATNLKPTGYHNEDISKYIVEILDNILDWKLTDILIENNLNKNILIEEMGKSLLGLFFLGG